MKSINFHEGTLNLGPEVRGPQWTVDQTPLATKQSKIEDYYEDTSVTVLFGLCILLDVLQPLE